MLFGTSNVIQVEKYLGKEKNKNSIVIEKYDKPFNVKGRIDKDRRIDFTYSNRGNVAHSEIDLIVNRAMARHISIGDRIEGKYKVIEQSGTEASTVFTLLKLDKKQRND